MATLRVIEPFTVFSDQTRVYSTGDLVDSGNPVVKGREKFFESVEVAVHRSISGGSVERATAAPGEKRTVTPAKRAASKKAGDS